MLEEFYRANFRIVYGYLLSLCGDKTLAEELTAETFYKAVPRIDRYDPRYKASTWLCTIARNLYINEYKRRKRHVPLEEVPELSAPSPEILYLKKEQAQAIIASAEQLPPLQRQVFYMRMEGMRFGEIALALGKTENWARVTYFRAKNKILTEVEGEK